MNKNKTADTQLAEVPKSQYIIIISLQNTSSIYHNLITQIMKLLDYIQKTGLQLNCFKERTSSNYQLLLISDEPEIAIINQYEKNLQ